MVATPFEISHRQFHRKPSENGLTRPRKHASYPVYRGSNASTLKKVRKNAVFCSFFFNNASKFRMIGVTEELKTFPQGPVLLAAETSSLNFNFTNYGGSIG